MSFPIISAPSEPSEARRARPTFLLVKLPSQQGAKRAELSQTSGVNLSPCQAPFQIDSAPMQSSEARRARRSCILAELSFKYAGRRASRAKRGERGDPFSFSSILSNRQGAERAKRIEASSAFLYPLQTSFRIRPFCLGSMLVYFSLVLA